MFRNRYLNAVLISLLSAILVVLYIKTSNTNHDGYLRAVTDIRDLQRLDADWNTQILRTGVALNKNFDPLAGVLPKIQKVKERMLKSELNSSLPELFPVRSQLEELLSNLDKKESLVEQFKSNHAVMRNSVRFLPTAERQVLELLDPQFEDAMLHAMHGLLGKIYTFVLLPSQETQLELSQSMRKLRPAQPAASARLAPALEMFMNHARIILDRNITAKDLMNQAVSIPTEENAHQLAEVYSGFHSKRLRVAEKFRIALIVFSFLLMGILVVLGIQLRKSYVALNSANKSLLNANENLEQKVEERTRRLRESQGQLVQSEKMAAIGQMVAGVAHEINTPLGYINSNVEIISTMLETVDEVFESMEESCGILAKPGIPSTVFRENLAALMRRFQSLKDNKLIAESKNLLEDTQYGIGQIDDIVVNLKEFSRMDRSKEADYDINEGIESTLKIAYNSYKHVARIEKRLGSMPKIQCFPSQINQVILNLVTNAAHAVTDCGREGIIVIESGYDENYVYFSVKDNGIGIAKEQQNRIFEPFFTTKDVGGGTGLGLSITHTIVKEHHGRIKLLSQEGVGSQFLISLPRQVRQNAEIPAKELIA